MSKGGSPLTTAQRIEIKRWRLILGQEVEKDCQGMLGESSSGLSDEELALDAALEAIYGGGAEEEIASGGKKGGRGSSAPRLARWLGDVRRFFPQDMVSVVQKDAIERKGWKSLLFEPETLREVQPSIALVSTLMALKGQIPEKSKDTARMVVRSVVEDIRKWMDQELRQAVRGALNRRQHSPIARLSSLDWKATIERNLKHYQPELKCFIPEKMYFYSTTRQQNPWRIFLAMDQSGSMADSVVYGSIMGSILASLPTVETKVIAFDTEVVDLSEQCGNDPVDMIFGVQLGGGTDINKAVRYCEARISAPAKTLMFLLTDLFEGGNQAQLQRRLADLVASGVRIVCLLALSDEGTPSYDFQLAKKLANMNIPCFACTPGKLSEVLYKALRGDDLMSYVLEKGGNRT